MIEYRVATSEDADRVAELHADSWRRAYRGMFRDEYLDGDLVAERRRVWQERLDRSPDNQFTWLAMNGAQLAGFVCAYGAADPEWGSLIDNLHVAHTHRRTGIATKLMRDAGEWLAEHYSDAGVYLKVLEGNAPARSFYATLGARNAEVSLNEVHPGGWARSCRYTWPSPAALTG